MTSRLVKGASKAPAEDQRRSRRLSYSRPPVVEALVEFRFSAEPQSDWDWLLPSAFATRVREQFPRRRAVHVVDVAAAVVSGHVGQELKVAPRFQLLSDDEKRIVQLGPGLLVVNELRYRGWNELRTLATEMLATFRAATGGPSLEQVSLRYINRIVVPGESIEMDDYFNALPKLPPTIPQMFGTWSMRVDVAYAESPPSTLQFQLSTAYESDEPHLAYTLDLTMTSVRLKAGLALGEWLDITHERVEEAFYASFTDRAHRELFGCADE